MLTWPLLALILLACGGRLLRPGAEGPWRHRVDWPLALLAGLVGAVWLTRVNGPFWFSAFPLTASDFGRYCTAVSGGPRAGDQASVVAGALPTLLAPRVGVLVGLAAGAFWATTLFCGALYACARLLHSRLAGGLTLGALCLFVPLTAMPRMMSFYPEVAAVAALATAGAVASLVLRTRGSAALAGLGAGLVAVSDVRGWLWVGPGLFVALVGALGSSRHSRWSRLLCLLAPVAVSWWFAGLPGVMPSASLSEQFAGYVVDAGRGRGLTVSVPAPLAAESFAFGTSPLGYVGPSLAYLQRTQGLISGSEPSPEIRVAWACIRQLGVLLIPCAVGAVLSLRRWPLRALGLAILVVPNVLAVSQAVRMLPHARQLLVPMMLGPVIIGVAAAGIFADSGPRWWPRLTVSLRDPPQRWRSFAWPVLQLVLVSCFALWAQFGAHGQPVTVALRWPQLVDSEPATTWAALAGGRLDPEAKECFRLMQAELAVGRSPWPWWIERPRSLVRPWER